MPKVLVGGHPLRQLATVRRWEAVIEQRGLAEEPAGHNGRILIGARFDNRERDIAASKSA